MEIYQESATLLPCESFNPATDATNLLASMKGFGTDEDKIIKILAHRTSIQRQEILKKYELAYSRDLIKDLKKELGGPFEEVIVAMMTPLPLFLAKEVHNALKGKKKNYNVVCEIICTRKNATIKAIAAAYEKEFSDSLEDDLKGENSDIFERLLSAIIGASRNEGPLSFDQEQAIEVAKSLFAAVEDELGINEAEINKILSTYSFDHLRQIFSEYKIHHKKTVGDSFESQFTGDIQTAMKTIFFCLESRPTFLAKSFYDTMVGSGYRGKDLIRLIVSRCELDLGNIKTEYQAMYGTGSDDVDALEQAILADTKGDFEKVLISLLKSKDEEDYENGES